MMNPSKFELLRSKLETVAFLVTQSGTARQAHAEIVQGLVLLAELESTYSKHPLQEAPSQAIANEINKVRSRLKLWARRPDAINARILTAYLRLERASTSTITVADLKNELPDVMKFESNFLQMRIMANKNHGKVFDIDGDAVTLWPPVEPEVREFERVVFGMHE